MGDAPDGADEIDLDALPAFGFPTDEAEPKPSSLPAGGATPGSSSPPADAEPKAGQPSTGGIFIWKQIGSGAEAETPFTVGAWRKTLVKVTEAEREDAGGDTIYKSTTTEFQGNFPADDEGCSIDGSRVWFPGGLQLGEGTTLEGDFILGVSLGT